MRAALLRLLRWRLLGPAAHERAPVTVHERRAPSGRLVSLEVCERTWIVAVTEERPGGEAEVVAWEEHPTHAEALKDYRGRR